MFLLDDLVRLSPDRVRCRLFLEGGPVEFTVRFVQFAPGVRGFDFEGMSPRGTYDLANRNEYRAFARTLWAYVDGAAVTLPRRFDVESIE